MRPSVLIRVSSINLLVQIILQNLFVRMIRNLALIRTGMANRATRKSPLGSQQIVHQAHVLHVSNLDSRYRLKYGHNFQTLLEPRDQVLEHQFNFSVPINLAELGHQNGDFERSQLYQDILQRIREFLVESVSNVSSVAFKFLCEGSLTENEAKEYAAKNILLNINSVFNKTVTAIENHPFITNILSQKQITQIKQSLAIEVDNQLSTILANLTDNYPQAPASGGTPRMREAILEINRVEDEDNDLIYANGLKIDIEKQQGREDYTEFIMQVINAAIKVTTSNEDDSRDRTVREIFTQFNEQLFGVVHQDQYRDLMSMLQSKQRDGKQLNEAKLQRKEKIFKQLIDYFKLTLQTNSDSLEKLEKEKESKLATLHKLNHKDSIGLNRAYSEDPSQANLNGQNHANLNLQFHQLLLQAENNSQSLRKDGKFQIGQKIPSFVKEFSTQEIANGSFEAKHSSVLRIMTKWAEYLQQLFQFPERSVYKRAFRFKTVANKLVHVRQDNKDAADKLVRRLKEEYEIVKKKYEVLREHSYGLIASILSQQLEGKTNVSRYSSTRAVASKINALLTFLMLKYLNLLIHHLLLAGKQIYTSSRLQDLNLVVFRVADLMRSKYQCSEAEFISLLKTMYILDENEEMKNKFRLVRIKNKLDDPANNIIINYLFMGKVQCELQLSIQEPKGKEKKYYAFSHFVYELIRGNFGAIAECAIMISQLDPMISASKGVYYSEKVERGWLTKAKRQQKESQISKKKQANLEECSDEEEDNKQKQNRITETEKNQKTFERSIKDPIFKCKTCRKLYINQSREIFKSKKGDTCNSCNVNKINPQARLKDKRLRSFVKEALHKKWLEKILSFRDLKELEIREIQVKHLLLATINSRGQLEINIAVQLQEELKILLVKINPQIFIAFEKKEFDFSSLESTDITRQIRKGTPSNDLLYSIKTLGPVQSYLGITGIEVKAKEFIDMFIEFRLEKMLINTIKAKLEVINVSRKPHKMQKLGQIIRAMQKGADKQVKALMYQKHTELDLHTVKQLYAQDTQLDTFPPWLPKLTHLKTLHLRGNKLPVVKEEQLALLPPTLTEFNISGCEIEKIAPIRYLPRINLLRLSSNKLTSVNLSNLASLTILSLNDNQLCSVDLRPVPNLLTLKLYKNQFVTVDLSPVPKLKQLKVEDNKFKSLNLKHLSQLQSLSVDREAILACDFKHNPQLQSIKIFNGKAKREELINVGEKVKVQNGKVQLPDLD